MCYLGRGENEEDITNLCRLLQKALKGAPKSVVIDYKSAWEVGIKKVFPTTLIIRDGFHTVRLLNTAILKELMTISEPMFASVIRETKRLTALIKKDQWQGNGVKFAPQNPVIKEFKYFYALLTNLSKISELSHFKKVLDRVIWKLRSLNTDHAHILWNELIYRLPAHGVTKSNVKYYKIKLRGALSLVMRQFRWQVERAKKEFMQVKYLLVKRPEHCSERQTQFLTAYLKKFPALQKYRALSLRISDIYHMAPELLTDSIITGIELWEDAIQPLTAAVTTLKKHVKEILNFKAVFPKGTPFASYKKVRTSPECKMRKIKDVYRNRYGFRTPGMSQLYLENELKCPVIIS